MRGKLKIMISALRRLCNFLPTVFWGLLIYGFDAPYMANITILSIIIHEVGHVLSLFLLRKEQNIRGVINGIRLSPKQSLSYREELLVALGGPLVNIIVGGLLLALPFSKEYIKAFAVMNLLTALSNLLPTQGSDGYRIIKSALALIFGREYFFALDIVSIVISILITLSALFLMLKIGEGYWIYCLFLYNSLSILENLRKRRIS